MRKPLRNLYLSQIFRAADAAIVDNFIGANDDDGPAFQRMAIEINFAIRPAGPSGFHTVAFWSEVNDEIEHRVAIDSRCFVNSAYLEFHFGRAVSAVMRDNMAKASVEQ